MSATINLTPAQSPEATLARFETAHPSRVGQFVIFNVGDPAAVVTWYIQEKSFTGEAQYQQPSNAGNPRETWRIEDDGSFTRIGRRYPNDLPVVMLKLDKATICYGGGFAYQTMKVKDLRISIGRHAQYDKAIHVEFIPKGKRNVRAFTQTYRPTLVVLEGHVDLKIPDTFGPDQSNTTGDVVTRKSRGMSCDPIWDQEFDQALKASGLKVVADYRGHDSKGG